MIFAQTKKFVTQFNHAESDSDVGWYPRRTPGALRAIKSETFP